MAALLKKAPSASISVKEYKGIHDDEPKSRESRNPAKVIKPISKISPLQQLISSKKVLRPTQTDQQKSESLESITKKIKTNGQKSSKICDVEQVKFPIFIYFFLA